MLSRFSTKELIFIAITATALFVVDFMAGAWVIALTGIPLSGSFISPIIAGFFVIFLIRTVPKFGTMTFSLFIFGMLALPTISAGPPGFWPKVIVEVLAGVSADTFLYLCRYKKWSIFVAFYVISTMLLYGLTFSMILMGIPESDKTLSIMPFVVLTWIAIGTVGLFLGLKSWERFKNYSIIKQICGT